MESAGEAVPGQGKGCGGTVPGVPAPPPAPRKAQGQGRSTVKKIY